MEGQTLSDGTGVVQRHIYNKVATECATAEKRRKDCRLNAK